ncbi:hypothetical protein [Brevibacillus daliensis]|uniref:hypothetical protein n=1 Tax=Brevibacillus daliensis TaxID=2892995 RepID=UPI001E386359|nr:hypothetical protein [Brevibacillus daliensis]
MKKLIYFTLISIVVFTWLLTSNFEFGKYDNFEEVLKKGIPYKILDVIHTQKVDNITVVMYITEHVSEEYPSNKFNPIAIAFLKGNDVDGWENIGSNGWEHQNNDNMTVYEKSAGYKEGNERLYVTFGEINNSEIEIVETKTRIEENFKKAKIITNDGNRYYFQVDPQDIVRGLSKEGNIVEQHGK